MGFFTWTYADRKVERNKFGDYKDSSKLPYGGHGCIICPDDTAIEEHHYEGYGIFNGQDIYDLVVDWNKGHLLSTLITGGKADPVYQELARFMDGGDAAGAQTFIDDAVNKGSAPEYLRKEWKRSLGIEVSFSKATLPYPIKITTTPKPILKYADLPASRPCQ